MEALLELSAWYIGCILGVYIISRLFRLIYRLIFREKKSIAYSIIPVVLTLVLRVYLNPYPGFPVEEGIVALLVLVYDGRRDSRYLVEKNRTDSSAADSESGETGG